MREARIWDSKQAVFKRAMARHTPSQWELLVAQAGRVDLMSKGRLQGDAWLGLERLLAAIAQARARVMLA